MKKILLIIVVVLVVFASFTFIKRNFWDNSNQADLDSPSRTAYDGCEWEKKNSDKLSFWGQRCDGVYLEFSDNNSRVVLNNDGYRQDVMRIFSIENGNVNDVLDTLRNEEGWDESERCGFHTDTSNARAGVTRYMLSPTGERLIQNSESEEPITHTCNGYGVGNSGVRYFEIQNNVPDKVVFMEIGQEAPLFDQYTWVIK